MTSSTKLNALLAILVLAMVGGGCAQMKREFAPNITGNYVLDYRELSDGRRITAPDVGGMMSFTRDMRNFNVFWMQDGKKVAISSVSRYRFEGDQYFEDCIFYAAPSTLPAGAMSGSSQFSKRDGGVVMFQFPLHGEPAVTVTRTSMSAIRVGEFVDHWKKVD